MSSTITVPDYSQIANYPPKLAAELINVATAAKADGDANTAKAPVRVASAATISDLSDITVADFDGTAQGVTLVEDDRVLVKDTASPDGVIAAHAKYNGIYVVGVVAGGHAALTRAEDFDLTAEVGSGDMMFVSEGTYAGLTEVLTTANPIVLGTTALTFGLAFGTAPDASTTVKGIAKMSVAPAVANTPISTGSNDPRVTVVEWPFALDGTDGSLAEVPLGSLGVACTITGATLEMAAAVTQNDTDYLTLTLAKRDGAGGGATTIAAPTTEATGGIALLAFREVSMGSLSNTSILATDKLTLKSVISASGQASGPGKIRLSFTVP